MKGRAIAISDEAYPHPPVLCEVTVMPSLLTFFADVASVATPAPPAWRFMAPAIQIRKAISGNTIADEV